ncbi:MAG: formylglycine-generating enzyme family protein [Cyanobacteria bacterium P01_F01_bin.116]
MVSFIPHREQRQARYFVEHLPSEIGLDMIRVPGGQFLMGSPEDELERKDTEGPQHEVAISTFFMGRYPITQAQWKAVAGLSQINSKLDPDPASFKGDNHPVENVSWNDSVEFCARLSTHTNREYRLPTEAEWEYACRAGTDTPFYFGETITTDLANYQGIGDKSLGWSGAYGQGPEGEYRGKTTPVDHFGIANAFGLCDMHGNIAEWCQDHWHKDYTEAPTDGTAWQMPNRQAVNRVLRGGSWISYPELCRSASRNHSMPNLRNHSFGLRVVCNAPRALQ